MPSKTGIRWKDSDLKTLRNLVKANNREIDRIKNSTTLNEKYGSLQPERLNVKQLRRTIKTRKEFDTLFKDVSNRVRYGGDRVVTGSKGDSILVSDVKNTERRVKTFNAKQTRRIKELDISPLKGTASVKEQQSLQKKKVNVNKTTKEWDLFKLNLEKRLDDEGKEAKGRAYYDDYKKAVTNFLGEDGDVINNYLDKNVSDYEDFIDSSLTDPLLNIQLTSDPLPVEELVDKILSNWKSKFTVEKV